MNHFSSFEDSLNGKKSSYRKMVDNLFKPVRKKSYGLDPGRFLIVFQLTTTSIFKFSTVEKLKKKIKPNFDPCSTADSKLNKLKVCGKLKNFLKM